MNGARDGRQSMKIERIMTDLTLEDMCDLMCPCPPEEEDEDELQEDESQRMEE